MQKRKYASLKSLAAVCLLHSKSQKIKCHQILPSSKGKCHQVQETKCWHCNPTKCCIAWDTNALVALGQHPKDYTDTVTILENVGHFIDEEVQYLFRKHKNEGLSNSEISLAIEQNLNIRKILERSSRRWDGGYAIAGIIGHGDAFVFRDEHGIRPSHFWTVLVWIVLLFPSSERQK